jgi:hypothetical protein
MPPVETQVSAENAPLIGAEPVEAATPEAVVETQQAEPVAAEVKTPEVTEEAPKPEVAPESYEDFQVPEGVLIDEPTKAEVRAVAKELNLTQAKAQLLIDKLGPQVVKSQQERFNAQIEKARADWTEASKTDKEFGGDKLDKSLGGANQVLKEYGSQELKQLLIESGLSNHPEIIRFMVKVRSAISEDTFVAGGHAPSTKKQGFTYPNSPDFK